MLLLKQVYSSRYNQEHVDCVKDEMDGKNTVEEANC